MPDIAWDESRPRNADRVQSLSGQWPSKKTAFRNAIEEHFHWSDSTSSAGEPKLSTSTPGSARFYYGTQSEVSNPGRPGAAMVVSDLTRFIGFDSGGSSSLGADSIMIGFTALDANSSFVVRDEAKVVSFHQVSAVVQGLNNAQFIATFRLVSETAPDVFLTPGASDNVSSASYRMSVTAVNASGTTIDVDYIGPGADPGTAEANIYSLGTLPL